MSAGITLEVVKVKGSASWAIKLVVDGIARYRGYHYRRDAANGLPEWLGKSAMSIRSREFMHNFHSAEELGIIEQ